MTDTTAPQPASNGNGPTIRRPRQGLPTPLLIGLAALAAITLFVILEGRRQDSAAPAVAGAGTATFTAPPPLAIPRDYPQPPQFLPAPVADPAPRAAPSAPPQPQIVYVPQPIPQPPQHYDPPPPPPRAVNAGPVVVYDGQGSAAGGARDGDPDQPQRGAAPAEAGRVRAGVLANRSTTVVQGSLIPAVLETPLDSSRPGFSRAVVSGDVRSFDGSRVLIPRGSRLIGEYRSEAALGQKRAFITWTRLIRPDGATISLNSPSGDPLGRGGIRAKVNSHFFSRFGEAILQSVLDIGVNAAASATDSPVVILPGAMAANRPSAPSIPPTLKVAQGTSISVFVARDLDFSGVERR
ncbi:MAG TPA: TrbI/VirB10 family protein [Sphingopyxis sp.]|nr:TrbI/VirB10 family protein [Sphingopyxis sp.]HMP45223.1 TrbI/VirB10 family protein [Sphingopyxis sp.]HMQ18766.1 TrbI/VirB10 family protein [Sphingopyxis sp.]